MNCCNLPVKSLAAWDDAQVTDHAYNLSMCELCGIVYKEDVWNDKGLRAILLNGKVLEITSDTAWDGTNLLVGLKGRQRDIVLSHFRRMELEELVVPLLDSAFRAVRRICDLIFAHEFQEDLLPMVEVTRVIQRVTLNRTQRSEMLKSNGRLPKSDSELFADMCQAYVDELVRKRKDKKREKV